jgi:hemolysin activation/secretion protein
VPRRSTLAHELYGSVRGQITVTNDRLPPGFAYPIGGLYTVRGYPEALVSGDDVVVATAEYRFHLPRLLPAGPPSEFFERRFRLRPTPEGRRPDWGLILRAFFDAGKTLRHGATKPEDSENSGETLVSAGFGFELDLRQNLTARIDWGWPLESTQEDVQAGDSRVHFLFRLRH